MTLLPFDSNATYYCWWLKWREHVRSAKAHRTNDAFCLAAMICNNKYVTELAFETVRLKKAGVIKDEN